MRYLVGILIGLGLFFSACNKIVLQEESEDGNTRLKASDVKALLYGQSNGYWLANYQGHEFFFEFTGTEGKVKVDSDFLQEEKTATARFATKGRAVSLSFIGGTHFSLLPPADFDDEFIIADIPSQGSLNDGIVLKGENSGNTLTLIPTTKQYIQAKVGTKMEFIDLLAKNLLDNGVLTDANGKLIAYYTMKLDYRTADYHIKVITIENKTGNDPNGHTQVYTSSLTKEGNVFKLNTPITAIKATNGATYSFERVNCNDVITVTGMPNVKISSNSNALALFDYTANKKWSFNKVQNQGAASDEIWNLTGGGTNIGGLAGFQLLGLDLMDPGMSPNERPMIFWTSGFKTRKFLGSSAAAEIRKTEELDLIFFTNANPDGVRGPYGDEHTPTELNTLKQYFKPLFDTWFNKQGLYVIKTQKANGSWRIYLLSPDTQLTPSGGSWMECQ